MMLIALTCPPSPRLAECELTYLERTEIDYALACEQHEAYCRLLRECGAEVCAVDRGEEFPDGVFVEDSAVVLDEVAILCLPGSISRRAEIQNVQKKLKEYREIVGIKPPATLEGGDVLRVGKTLFVGISTRTNTAGVKELREIVMPYGYNVIPVEIKGCLHLKTGCCALDEEMLLVNPNWVEQIDFKGLEIICVPPDEPWAANVLCFGKNIVMNSACSLAVELVQQKGFAVRTVDISEFSKAEAGLSCMSLLFGYGG